MMQKIIKSDEIDNEHIECCTNTRTIADGNNNKENDMITVADTEIGPAVAAVTSSVLVTSSTIQNAKSNAATTTSSSSSPPLVRSSTLLCDNSNTTSSNGNIPLAETISSSALLRDHHNNNNNNHMSDNNVPATLPATMLSSVAATTGAVAAVPADENGRKRFGMHRHRNHIDYFKNKAGSVKDHSDYLARYNSNTSSLVDEELHLLSLSTSSMPSSMMFHSNWRYIRDRDYFASSQQLSNYNQSGYCSILPFFVPTAGNSTGLARYPSFMQQQLQTRNGCGMLSYPIQNSCINNNDRSSDLEKMTIMTTIMPTRVPSLVRKRHRLPKHARASNKIRIKSKISNNKNLKSTTIAHEQWSIKKPSTLKPKKTTKVTSSPTSTTTKANSKDIVPATTTENNSSLVLKNSRELEDRTTTTTGQRPTKKRKMNDLVDAISNTTTDDSIMDNKHNHDKNAIILNDEWQEQFLNFLTYPSDHIKVDTGRLVPLKDTIIWGRQKFMWTASNSTRQDGCTHLNETTAVEEKHAVVKKKAGQPGFVPSRCGGNMISQKLFAQAVIATSAVTAQQHHVQELVCSTPDIVSESTAQQNHVQELVSSTPDIVSESTVDCIKDTPSNDIDDYLSDFQITSSGELQNQSFEIPPTTIATKLMIRRTCDQALWFHGGDTMNLNFGQWIQSERESYQHVKKPTAISATQHALHEETLILEDNNKLQRSTSMKKLPLSTTKKVKGSKAGSTNNNHRLPPHEIDKRYKTIEQSFRYHLLQLIGIDLQSVRHDETVFNGKYEAE